MLKDLNLKHLYYFWVIAEAGSIARASDQLDLSPQTLSGQLSAFEAKTGALFFRKGRGLKLTPLGEQARRYASQIFALAGELDQVLKQPEVDLPLDFSIGFAASVHKLIAYHLITPAMAGKRPLHLKANSGHLKDLLRSLQRQQLDLVISDEPPSEVDKEFYFTPLFSSSLSLFAAPDLAKKLRPNFPHSLHQQPLLSNGTDTVWFTELTHWLKKNKVEMQVCAEISDSALIKVFARASMGVFAAPTNIKDEVCRQYLVEEIGEIREVFAQHYAITRTPDPIHPAIHAILVAARQGKFIDKN
ncbi:LysR family transcriptional regulator [Oceanospirillum beijerinckii]|uniref:LysR family transcriptional regulator n=1 Tax=Oceanospirillum beijerinckii TaxID=64976 RepID=UPI00042939FA|nr:LysR family transcriptional regulator [Oceanospirillum beijerinckii]MAC47333.1 LysR family transcriptional regulator [Oceanospirillum sp.]